MNILSLLFFIIPFIPLVSSQVKTDQVIFLFDQGDKNMVSSMLKYGETHYPSLLDSLDFQIVFMGSSCDAMSKEPFCHYPDKLIHYKMLGIEETIDHTWKRGATLSQKSLESLTSQLHIQKKLWVPVSNQVFAQILEAYEKNEKIEGLALRDNPHLEGNSDYFTVAEFVQKTAHVVAVPSALYEKKAYQKSVIVGHGPIEEWVEEVKQIDSKAVIERLGLNPEFPILVYAGGYGDFYEKAFLQFLQILQSAELCSLNLQVLVVPHPRYKGAVEKALSADFKHCLARFVIVGEWEEEPLKRLKTIEAISVADAVVTADATSTIVLQAKATKRAVLHINPEFNEISQKIAQMGLLTPVLNGKQLLEALNCISFEQEEDLFSLLEIPREGAKLLWEEWVK